ncbi:hypothetical protein E1B28_000599 [Marasmius oreades]|uniref:peptidylprolyl isomerase n=1 Tax=Marasmius oreades TaxID=181124 RepID=A0A9P8AES4_9AGAR|nr:uncharacterized protein E1B28_000599 [Marasmius oreades]KAG7098685.1 hypothetical protein E1B28_000599 [Marasmius oreades]
MSVTVGLWSHAFIPGKPESVIPIADLRITNASLGDVLVDEKGRTVLKMTFERISIDEDDGNDEEGEEMKEKGASSAFVCSLVAGKTEQTVLDITLLEETEYIFEVVGKNTVYMIGNYIDQNANQPPYGESDIGSDDEGAYDLQEVSSDVEMHPDDLDGMESDASGIEDVAEGAAKTKKRARESDVAEGKPASNVEKKNKKQKVEVARQNKEEKTEKTEKAGKKDKKDKKDQAEKAEATVKELPGGLKIKDAKVGNGVGAKKGQKIEMRYIGKLADGKVFDSNTKGAPFKFRLGDGEVIRGWDEGLVGIKVGGERLLTIPPAMGYGKKGSGPIPGNATLTFEVKCVGVK